LAGWCLLLALGGRTPLLAILYASVPGFDLFKAVARFLCPATVFIGLLAGLGVDCMLDTSDDRGRRFLRRAAVVVCCAAMVFLGFHLRHGIWSMFQSIGAMPGGASQYLYRADKVEQRDQNLIVPRPGRMDLLAHRPQSSDQMVFYGRVAVLLFRFDLESSVPVEGNDIPKLRLQPPRLLGADQPNRPQHPGVSDAGRAVIRNEREVQFRVAPSNNIDNAVAVLH
jgi:hypothetical protein